MKRLSFLILSAVAWGDDRFENIAAQSELPREAGLAAAFKADAGVADHKAVIFADNFEDGELGARWDERGKPLTLAPAGGGVVGKQCLKVTATLGENEGGGLTKWFEPADTVFVRFYTRFDEGCDYVHHFVTVRSNK